MRIILVIITIMILALFSAPTNLYSQNTSAQNMTNSNLTGNATEPSVVEPLGRPEDLANGDSQFSLHARKIAMELTKITPAELSQYPITDLSREDIQSVLGLLNPHVLAKVLLTIEVRVNTTQGYEPTVNLIAKSQSKNMVFDFTQNDTSNIPISKLRIPSYGVATVPLTITSAEAQYPVHICKFLFSTRGIN